jgi:hypothetical protein
MTSLFILALAAFAFASTPGPVLSEEPSPRQPVKVSVDFAHQVMPLVNRLGCNQAQCHGAPDGKGELRFSMFGAAAADDYEALAKSAKGRRINLAEPRKSLLLQKATASIAHGGGQKIAVDSAEYKILLDWISQGAVWEDAAQPKLLSIEAAPQELMLGSGKIGQLHAAAILSDGTQRDITRDAVFASSDKKVATVDAAGKVKAEGYGQTAIVVTYLRQPATVVIMVPRPLHAGFPDIAANNRVDELVFAHLKKLGIRPSEVCADEVFLRRVYLDTIGILPTPDEARAFLTDNDSHKRSTLIDRLLERDEFADYWALKWGDLLRIKSEFPVRLWPKAVQTYYRWVHDSIAQNKPYDQFVRELLTSHGSNFRSGPANFFRGVPTKDPQTIAETTALVFMGARVSCARCHGHPVENWSQNDDLGMAAFFGKVAFKNTTEWKEEIVYFNPKAAFHDPNTKAIVKPKFLGGKIVELGPREDPRVKFADWLIAPQNPWFTKNIVNRVWSWVLGRGIVHEPDDLRSTNPPSNPELLDYLAAELVGHKYDLKHVFRSILNSKTYQLSSDENEGNKGDAVQFSHYGVKRLAAEQLLDAIGQVTATSETFTSRIPEPYTRLPPGYRAGQIADGNIESPILDLFGRPPRDTPYESERTCTLSMRQTLYFVNSDHLEGKIASSERLQRLIQEKKSDAEIIDEVFLAALSRFPTKDERQKLTDYMSKNKSARVQAVRDLLWAVLNTNEFMFNH